MGQVSKVPPNKDYPSLVQRVRYCRRTGIPVIKHPSFICCTLSENRNTILWSQSDDKGVKKSCAEPPSQPVNTVFFIKNKKPNITIVIKIAKVCNHLISSKESGSNLCKNHSRSKIPLRGSERKKNVIFAERENSMTDANRNGFMDR